MKKITCFRSSCGVLFFGIITFSSGIAEASVSGATSEVGIYFDEIVLNKEPPKTGQFEQLGVKNQFRLPQTGEVQSALLVVLGVVFVGMIYIVYKKRKRKGEL